MTAGVGSSRSLPRSREGTHPVSARVSPTDRLHAEIDQVFATGDDLATALEQVARLGAQLLLQAAVEAEVTGFLGRDSVTGPAEAAGHHRGVRLAAVRDGGDAHQRARGLGDRLVRPRAVDPRRRGGAGRRPRGAGQRVPVDGVADLRADQDRVRGLEPAAARRRHAGLPVSRRQPLSLPRQRRRRAGAGRLGIDTDGQPVFVGLGTAASESGDAWGGFLTDLGARGLRCPLLVISDGATGLISAVERTMSGALRQRCLIHRARNILAKVPKNAQAGVKADYWAIFEVPDTVEPGPAAVRHVQNRIDSFARRWRDSYPAAVRCLLDGRDNLTVYLRFPREHWNRIRHSNFIERTFGETRRRVKVAPAAGEAVDPVLDVPDRGRPGLDGVGHLEDRPIVGLDPGLGVLGYFGQDVAGTGDS